jgi:hypothetical protein
MGMPNRRRGAAGVGGVEAFDLSNCIVLDGAGDYLSKTFSSASSNNKKSTIAFSWKATTFSENNNFLEVKDGNSLVVKTITTAKILIGLGGANSLITTATYSTGVWYHMVLQLDTAQATAADRITLTVDGTKVTSFDAENYGSQNADTFVCGAHSHEWGRVGTLDFNGRMTQIVAIEGDSVAASNFQTSGVPIDVSGLTFGAQGHWLQCNEIGTDGSGNSNDFTGNGDPSITADVPS